MCIIVLCTSSNACFSVTPLMELRPNAGSDRAWVWNTHADFADECPKPELLAIRFLNAESEWTAAELVVLCSECCCRTLLDMVPYLEALANCCFLWEKSVTILPNVLMYGVTAKS